MPKVPTSLLPSQGRKLITYAPLRAAIVSTCCWSSPRAFPHASRPSRVGWGETLLAWQPTSYHIRRWRCLLTGRTIERSGETVTAAAILGEQPVAVFEALGEARQVTASVIEAA
jgi:hypothetical protein